MPKERGKCSAVDDECLVASDEDCAGSAVCERNGCCERRELEAVFGALHLCAAGSPKR